METPDYINRNFEPNDRLAVVLVNKRAGSVIQRLATADKIASPEFQAWLRYQNAGHFEVYLSMNALRDGASGRTKDDIGTIRHLYLDLDENGNESLRAIHERSDLPKPHFVVNTSPNKWQVIWKVERFTRDQAEALQRALARDTGADIAATDCSRVLRLPGFYNHKYAQPHLVRVESPSEQDGAVYSPEHFPIPTRLPVHNLASRDVYQPRPTSGRSKFSQSERDWAYAKRALARGESPTLVAAAIATFRRYDKHNPQYYAELTVKRAGESLNKGRVAVQRNDGPQR